VRPNGGPGTRKIYERGADAGYYRLRATLDMMGLERASLLALLLLAPALAAAQCAPAVSTGFRVVQVPDGPKMAVWYPSSSPEAPHSYSRFVSGSVALGGAPADCERVPLVLFSHGFNGCGTQSIFLTESIARAGYVVAAPDHHDAACSVDGRMIPHPHLPAMPFSAPSLWRDSVYASRRADLERVLAWLLEDSDLRDTIDGTRVGAAGHSLGGYTVLGIAGAWDSWRDPRIKAVLALAPYVKPYEARGRLASITAPVMYQDAQFDFGITPSLAGERGAFALTGGPKYLVELRGGAHFAWTNIACVGHRPVAGCLAARPNARRIVDYSIAFLDRYLKDRPERLGALDGRGLRAYMREDQPGTVHPNIDFPLK
jgi:predicted dienelactone hydrolase